MHPAEGQCDQPIVRVSPVLRRAGQRAVRLTGLAVAAPCAAVLVLAAMLHPDSRGYDTHTQLGLPPCGFVQRTGLPCPTCGMTTAFSHLMRGRPLKALRTQPFGAVLGVATILAAAAGFWQAVSGRNVLGRLRPRPWWFWLLGAGVMVGWAAKIAIGLATGELPIH